MKKTFWSFFKLAALLAVPVAIWAGTGSPPAGDPILNQSNPQNAIFNVSSGTIRGQASVGTIRFPDGSIQVSSAPAVPSSIPASLPLPGGATNYIQATNSLQAGATFYVTSGTVSGNLTVGAISGNGSGLTALNASALTSGVIPNARLNSSSATLQGNIFNGAGELVQLDGGSNLPAVSAQNLTDIPGPNIMGQVPAASLAAAILNQNTLQTGTTFYVSSGAVSGRLTVGSEAIGALSGVLKASTGVVAGSATTSDLPEGSNLYFTNARAQGSLSASAPIIYSSGTGVISIDGSSVTLRGNLFNVSNALLQLSGSGLVPNSLIDASSITKQGNVFNTAGELVQLSGSALIPNSLLDVSSITKQGNVFNSANELLLINSSGFVPISLLDASTVTKQGNVFNGANELVQLNSSSLISNALIDTSSVTKQGNTFNSPSELLQLNIFGLVPTSLLDSSSVTIQGNTFNGVDELVQTNGSGLVPNTNIDTSSVTKQGNTFNGASQLLLLNSSDLIANSLIDTSSVTKQGNTFNGASQLLKLSASDLVPNSLIDVSSITKQGLLVAGANVVLTPGAGTTVISSFSSGESNLAISNGGVIVSSPTAVINFSSFTMNASLQSGGTAFIDVNYSSITAQGNTFNGVSNLLQLDGSGLVPDSLLDVSSVTKQGVLTAGTNITLTPGSGTLTITAAGSSGSTIYPASGTASFPLGFTASTITANSYTIGSSSSNEVFGNLAGKALALGSGFNSFFGVQAGSQTTTGILNSCFGYQSCAGNLTGNDNTAIGWHALLVSTGAANVAIGEGTLSTFKNSADVAIGQAAGNNDVNGNSNTFLGPDTNLSTTTIVTNSTAVGYSAEVGESNALVLGTIQSVSGSPSTQVGIGITTPTARIHIVNDITTQPVITLTPAGSQTSPTVNITNSSGVTVSSIGPTGIYYGNASGLTNLPVPAINIAAFTASANSNITPAASTTTIVACTIDAAMTINGPTGGVDGQKMVFRITDSSNTFSVTFSTGAGNYEFGTTFTTYTVTASKTDYLGAIYNAAANLWHLVSMSQGF